MHLRILPLGVLLLQIWAQKLMPQHLISRVMGRLARCRVTWLKNFLIRLFIKHYQVDMSEAMLADYRAYGSFNEFFARPLKSGARSLPEDMKVIACPVDGFISELGAIQEQQLFQAKGHTYSLVNLLGGDQEMAQRFQNGIFLTTYLSPKDYHRVHMPVSGTLKKMLHVPGVLFSVNPYTVRNVPNLFARNERVVCYFETDRGPMAVIMVGAIIVASIVMKWHGIVTPPTQCTLQQWNYENNPVHMNRGDELGYFLVGSTVIVLFGKNSAEWNSDLQPGQTLHMGQSLSN